jgi:ATP-binding protein involved in chromosome partitioning
MSLTESQIRAAIAEISVPPNQTPLGQTDGLQEVEIKEGVVRLALKLEGLSPDDRGRLEDALYDKVSAIEGVKDVLVKFRAEKVSGTGEKKRLPILGQAPAGGGGGHGHSHGGGAPVPRAQTAPTHTGQPIPGVKNIIAVASGKGGVGKSTVSVNLALALQKRGDQVGLLDIDIYGPSLHVLLGVNSRPHATPDGKIAPIEAHGMKLMSLAFISGDDTPMIWRGPMVMGVVSQFLQEVDWAPLDYLVIDLPPGTGDAQLTLVQKVPVTAAVIVTTPSDIALVDARKGLQMFRKTDVPVLGIIENMSYFLAPDTGKRYDIFGHGGAKQAADELGTPFLGEVPLDMDVRSSGDAGKPIVLSKPDGLAAKPFFELADRVRETLGKKPSGEGEKKKGFLGRIFGR